MFLTEAELIELTGYRQPAKQVAHLKAQRRSRFARAPPGGASGAGRGYMLSQGQEAGEVK